jgi:hypothetical protein
VSWCRRGSIGKMLAGVGQYQWMAGTIARQAGCRFGTPPFFSLELEKMG